MRAKSSGGALAGWVSIQFANAGMIFRHLEHEANKLLARGLSDSSTINWWRAVAVGFVACNAPSGKSRLGEALRELSSLKSKRDLELPAIVALLFFHKTAEHVDYQEVDALSSQAASEAERASEPSLLLAAQFYWYSGIHSIKEEEAREWLSLSRDLVKRVAEPRQLRRHL